MHLGPPRQRLSPPLPPPILYSSCNLASRHNWAAGRCRTEWTLLLAGGDTLQLPHQLRKEGGGRAGRLGRAPGGAAAPAALLNKLCTPSGAVCGRARGDGQARGVTPESLRTARARLKASHAAGKRILRLHSSFHGFTHTTDPHMRPPLSAGGHRWREESEGRSRCAADAHRWDRKPVQVQWQPATA